MCGRLVFLAGAGDEAEYGAEDDEEGCGEVFHGVRGRCRGGRRGGGCGRF